MVSLKRNSLHYRIQAFAWGNYTGKNFCDYFWRIVFGIILFPIAIVGWVLNQGALKSEGLHNVGLGLFPSGLVCMQVFTTLGMVAEGAPLALALTVFPLSIILLIGFLALLFAGEKKEIVKILQTKIQSAKDQVCPLIDWS